MAETTLRVGILSNGPVLERWQAECVRQVAAVPGVELVVWVMPPPTPQASVGLGRRILRHPWRTALYRRYRHRPGRFAALEPVDMGAELDLVPRLECMAEGEGPVDRFPEEALAALRAHRPDVLLRFGYNILKGPLLDLPRHGVWSFHHGDETRFRGGPPGFWEIMQGDPVTGAMLQRLTERLDAGRVLCKGWFPTVPHSLRETVDTVMLHTTHWPAQVCRRLLAGEEDAAVGEESAASGPLYRYPENLTFLRFLWRQLSARIRFHRRHLREQEEWNIGVLYAPIHSLLAEDPSLNVRWLPQPGKGSFRADPFGFLSDDGQLNVLYEKFSYARGTGEIARLRPKRDNVLKRSRTLLDTGSHLSYPFVLERPDGIHVVPESAASGRVVLYRLSDDRERLDPVCTLLEEAVYDPTLFQHEGRWWLFGTVPPLSNVALHAWYADRLEGPWTPHALNPLKLDIRGARPAGTPFVHGGHLHRPAQDSSHTYGHRIAIQRILRLTPTAFEEVTVKHIGPLTGTAYNRGLHTLSAVGDLTLVDGKRFVHLKEEARRRKGEKWDRLKRRSG